MANYNVQLKSKNKTDLLFPKTLVDNVVEIDSKTGEESTLTSLLKNKVDKSDLTDLNTKLGNLTLVEFDDDITNITDAINDLNSRLTTISGGDDALFSYQSSDASLHYDLTYDDEDKVNGVDIKIQYVDPNVIYFSDDGEVKIEDGHLLQVDKKRLYDSGIHVNDIIFSEEI